jgi:hypothetical protein
VAACQPLLLEPHHLLLVLLLLMAAQCLLGLQHLLGTTRKSDYW